MNRVFDAPIEKVWKAWTTPEEVMKWWGPEHFTSPSCQIDFREGGRYIFHMKAPEEQGGQDYYNSGVYTKIVPMERIEITDSLSDKEGNKIDPVSVGMPTDFPKETHQTFVFKDMGGKTEVTVTEHSWTEGQMFKFAKAGLSQSLDKLEKSLKN